jgi:hypothetical protein
VRFAPLERLPGVLDGLGDVPEILPLVILGRRRIFRMRPERDATISDRDTPDAFSGTATRGVLSAA